MSVRSVALPALPAAYISIALHRVGSLAQVGMLAWQLRTAGLVVQLSQLRVEREGGGGKGLRKRDSGSQKVGTIIPG